jgi:hypothetical protein
MVVAGWMILAVVSDPAASALTVTGTTSCPTAVQIESALAGLIGPADPERAPDVATVTDDAGSVVISLRNATGEPIGEKRLDPGLSCEQRARAAAVTIAAWEARLGTQTTTLVVPQAAPAAVTGFGAAPPAVTARPPPEPFHVEPGVGIAAAMNGTTLAPAATIEVAFSRRNGILIPAAGALVVGSHAKDVGSGDGTWRRYGLLATIGSRRAWSSTWAEARLGIALTLLHISGDSFQRNTSGVTIDPGIPIGVRFGIRSRPVRWWIDGTIAFWPREQTLYVVGVPGSTTLPRGEALVGLGASYEGR